MNNNRSLAITGFVFSLISVVLSIILVFIVSESGYSDNKASVFMELALYTALPGVICSTVTKLKKTDGLFSIVGIAAGVISVSLIFITFTISI